MVLRFGRGDCDLDNYLDDSFSNGAEKKMTQVHTCTTFKRIELESPGWSGFLTNSTPDQS